MTKLFTTEQKQIAVAQNIFICIYFIFIYMFFISFLSRILEVWQKLVDKAENFFLPKSIFR